MDEGAAALALNPVRGVLAANAIQKLEDYRDKATKSGAPTWVMRKKPPNRGGLKGSK